MMPKSVLFQNQVRKRLNKFFFGMNQRPYFQYWMIGQHLKKRKIMNNRNLRQRPLFFFQNSHKRGFSQANKLMTKQCKIKKPTRRVQSFPFQEDVLLDIFLGWVPARYQNSYFHQSMKFQLNKKVFNLLIHSKATMYMGKMKRQVVLLSFSKGYYNHWLKICLISISPWPFMNL